VYLLITLVTVEKRHLSIVFVHQEKDSLMEIVQKQKLDVMEEKNQEKIVLVLMDIKK